MNSSDAFALTFVLIPIISSLSCSVTALIFSFEQVELRDRRIARILFYYFASCVVGWFSVFAYRWIPAVFVCVQSLCYFAFMANSVLFYQLVFEVTRGKGRERFPWWHYVAPAVVSVALLIWSAFVPFGVQLEIVGLGGGLHPDYRWYSVFFTSKVAGRMLFCVVYTVLGMVRLRRYRRSLTPEQRCMEVFWMRWVTILIALSCVLFILPMLALVFSRGAFFQSWTTLAGALLIVCLQVLLITNVIKKNWGKRGGGGEATRPSFHAGGNVPLRDVLPDTPPHPHGNPAAAPCRPLTLEEFVDYFRTERPYLRPDLKLTDLCEVTGMGRNKLSEFINKNMGMNFNAYVNRWRLEELERIMADEGAGREGLMRSLPRAGFGSYRSYIRAKGQYGGE